MTQSSQAGLGLPLRIVSSGPYSEPLISVDGAFGAPGLNLSHWPGNTTPHDLKHELSTGSALAFVSLPQEEQAQRTAGCVAIANNHMDTDGICSMFVLAHPKAALERAEKLLAAARAGDFFAPENEAAFIVDAIVTGCIEGDVLPWELPDKATSDERHALCVSELMNRLPAILDGEIDPYAKLWQGKLDRWRADRARLDEASYDELLHLELAVWTTKEAGSFDIGRHALWSKTPCDRILLIGPEAGGGASYRLLIGTRSWFDLRTPGADDSLDRHLERPDLASLAARLNELEGSKATGQWHAQDSKGASPELWFGEPHERSFPEFAEGLRPSALKPETVRAEVIDALRAVWSFPDEVPDDEFESY